MLEKLRNWCEHSVFTVLAFVLILGASVGPSRASTCQPVTVLVAYFSETGKTAQLAAAVAEGAKEVEGARVELSSIGDVDPQTILAADAIIVGSPVKNAAVAPEVQEFINSWPFRGGPLRDKIGATFVTGGGFSAGEEAVQLSILRSMLVFGMVVAGGPHWTSGFGASAITEEAPFDRNAPEIDERFRVKGMGLGRRIAELAAATRCRALEAAPDLSTENGN